MPSTDHDPPRHVHDPFSREAAETLDKSDPLAPFRDEFYQLPPPGTLYFDGNSLGLCSRRAEKAVLDAMQAWRTLGINGWTDAKSPWLTLSEDLGARMAALVGADPDEVLVTGSTTANMHQLVASFYRPQGKRTLILADELAFPTDIHVLKAQILLQGLDPRDHLVRVQSRDGRLLDEKDIIDAMGHDVAVAIFPSVLYRSAQLLNIERIASAARERGILLGIDASHSIGSVPHSFSQWGVDFAFWCTYKHLNGGPGAVGGLYVARRHHVATFPALAGWFGARLDTRFDMSHEFDPADGVSRFQMGTPHVLSMAPLLGTLQLFEEAGIDRIRAKSLRLTRFLINQVKKHLSGFGFTIGTPTEDWRRGGHVAIEHVDAVRICRALKADGVIPDYRAPNIIRLAPIALYSTFAETWDVVQKIKAIMTSKRYERYPAQRPLVA